jgi:hypothetical protein
MRQENNVAASDGGRVALSGFCEGRIETQPEAVPCYEEIASLWFRHLHLHQVQVYGRKCAAYSTIARNDT